MNSQLAGKIQRDYYNGREKANRKRMIPVSHGGIEYESVSEFARKMGVAQQTARNYYVQKKPFKGNLIVKVKK